MNNNIRALPNGDFEVVYTPEHPCPGRVEVLVDGAWYPRLPYEPYEIGFAAVMAADYPEEADSSVPAVEQK